MEIFLLAIVLLMLIFIIRYLSSIKEETARLQTELEEVKKLINTRPPQAAPPTPQTPPAPVKTLLITPPAPPVPSKEPVKEAFRPVQWTEPLREEPAETKQGWFRSWLLANPDIEKFIGENLINKIGIAVLVFGIAFFVKYAIDQEWINKVGRVSVGLLCGVILTFFANRLRKNYHAFSSVLVGGAISIFYFTIAFAFHQYHLFNQGIAFAIMVVITLFAVILSVLYDRIELGIIATVGGFITPFLVSQGDGNWFVLFLYLTILNVGLIFLGYYKRWRIINFIAFIFTQFIYMGWVISKAGDPGFNYEGIFLFGMVFYLAFLAMNVIHHVVRGSKLKAFDFIILLSVNLCFYGAGMYLIKESNVTRYSGLFTASLGVVNLVLAYLFFRKSKADKNFIYLLIGITISFISLAAPVELKGHYITMFWSAEIVVLFWLYKKSLISLLKITVLIVTGLMLVSLAMDWSSLYSFNPAIHPVLFNKGWITGLFSAVSCFLVYRLLKKEADSFFIRGITNESLRNIYLFTSVVLFFTAGALEINDQFTKRLPGTGMQVIYLQWYLALFILVLFFLLDRFKTAVHPFLRLSLPFIAFGIYMISIYDIHATEKLVLEKGEYKALFAGSWISAIFLVLLVWTSIGYIRKSKPALSYLLPHLIWVTAILCVVIASVEISHFFIWINYTDSFSFDREEAIFDKAGLTILWAIASFIMIWMGMKYSLKPLRITALVLFGITLLKLFLFDIRNIAPGGKIIAFILLGALLLIISFMYQRLKTIIIDDGKKPE